MRKLFLLFVFAGVLAAQSSFTNISDASVRTPDGLPFSGTIYIRWSDYIINSKPRYAGEMPLTVEGGVLNISLAPNDQMQPAGSVYSVTYIPDTGSPWSAVWRVPTSSSTITLADVQGASSSSETSGPDVINFHGDSLTAGTQDGQGDSMPNYVHNITGADIINWGIPGQTSAQILGDFNQAGSTHGGCNVFWVGRNDVATSFTDTTSNLQAMTSQVDPTCMVVIGIIPASGEPSGSTTNNQILAKNAQWTDLYAGHFVNALSELLADYDHTNAEDTYDVGRGVPPYTHRAVISSGNLATAISDSSSCTFSLAATAAFVSGGIVSAESEYILTSAGNGANITGCIRGHAGTTATSHASGTAYTYTDALHLGANGYQVVARAVAPLISSTSRLPKRPLTTDVLYNVKIGTYALNNVQTASLNSAEGYGALSHLTTGTMNVANGWQALFSSLIGNRNIAIGASSLQNYLGSDNIGIGAQTLFTNTAGSGNIGIGGKALFSATGALNTGIGQSTLMNTSSGTRNFAAMYMAGSKNTTGSDNGYLGYMADNASSTQHNHMWVIGNNATGDADNSINLGRTGTTTATNDVTIIKGLFTAAAGPNVLPPAANYSQGCAWINDPATGATYQRTETGGGTNPLERQFVCSNGTVWQDH